MRVSGRLLSPGEGSGETLHLSAPVSFWGGVDPHDSRIIERRHPQFGVLIRGRVVVMEGGKGSSSGSSVLAEMVRMGTAPAGIVVSRADPILAVGALVAAELYGHRLPVVLVTEGDLDALTSVRHVHITDGGVVAGG